MTAIHELQRQTDPARVQREKEAATEAARHRALLKLAPRELALHFRKVMKKADLKLVTHLASLFAIHKNATVKPHKKPGAQVSEASHPIFSKEYPETPYLGSVGERKESRRYSSCEALLGEIKNPTSSIAAVFGPQTPGAKRAHAALAANRALPPSKGAVAPIAGRFRQDVSSASKRGRYLE